MKRSWWLFILPLVILLWWGLNRRQSVPEVRVAQVDRLTIESTVPTNGKVEPVVWAAARAETAGVVRSVEVQRGQSVAAGQTLITLDTTAAQSDLAAALAREQEAHADLAAVNQGGRPASLANVNDEIESARAAVQVAQRNYDVNQRLYAQNAVTKLQVQDAQDALYKAKLQLAAYENQRKTLVTLSDRTIGEAKLRDAQAAVTLARNQLAKGAIVAPVAGVVYQFDLKVGAYLEPGQLVALVGRLDQVKVIVYVDEPDLGRVAEGMPVSISWDARPNQTWWGRVEKLPTEVIALNTRSVGEVTTVVDNPNDDLLPGVTVNVTIISQVVKNGLAIPKSALRNANGQSGAYKVEGDTVKWVKVTAGVSDVNNVQIVSGLKAGDRVLDRVVSPPDAEIQTGMRVRVAKD